MATSRSVRTSRRTTSKALSYVTINKFQGGITAQPDKVQIPMGFSPMARNVEWYQQGGFAIRKGVGSLIYGSAGAEMAPPGAVPLAWYHYVRDPSSTAAFTSQYLVPVDDGRVLVGVDHGAPLGTDGTWQTMQAAGSNVLTLGAPVITAWDTNAYLSIGTLATSGVGQAMVRWNATTATRLGTAFVDDYAAPTGGNMPTARYVTAWAERMWVGCCLPGSTMEPSMVRWSHPGRAEDWATADFIRVGQAGDVITGIAPMRDMLVVFKRSSTYALLGSGATNFRVVQISGTIGCTGEWTLDNQGSVVFWDATVGACRFDGKSVQNIFQPLGRFLSPGVGASIKRCGGVVTDGERIYVATDFVDYYAERVPDPIAKATGRSEAPLIPGQMRWDQLTGANMKWAAPSGVRWMQASVEFYNIVWVFREGAGWTSFTLQHPDAQSITMLGQVRSRLAPTGDIESNRRIVYGLSEGTVPIYLSDRYDDGKDWWKPDADWHRQIDAFYMTPWLHGGLPAQIKRWKAPRIIQEADEIGTLLIDVYYDFNYDFLRRTLRTGVLVPLSFDSYLTGKPGTIGRAKAVMLVIRALEPRHWGVSSITIPVHPKVMR